MKTYRRASAAYKAAGDDQPILILRIGKQRLYVVGVDSMDGIELLAPPRLYGFSKVPSRSVAAQVLLGHLDRLGNANHAGAARYDRERRVWPERWGLSETFLNPTDEARFREERSDRNERQHARRED